MPSILRCLPALILAVSSSVALAHPGHGVTNPDSVAHQIVEPIHAVPWLLLIGIAITLTATAGLLWKQHRDRRAAAAASGRTRSTTERS